MRVPSAAELLRIQDAGSPLGDAERSLLLLKIIVPEHDHPEDFTVGQRDTYLWQLRKEMFGSRLQNCSTCPVCGEKVEWENDITEFQLPALTQQENNEASLEAEGFWIRYRLPTISDLIAIGRHTAAEREMKLLHRCLIAVTRQGRDMQADDLPPGAFQQLDKAVAAANRAADIQLLLTCPVCAGQWEAVFDIMRYLWKEMSVMAADLLNEVFIIARNFGWSESDILNMNARRRRHYINGLIA